MKAPFQGFATDAIHAGQEPDPYSGAVMVPISLSSTYAQKSPGVCYPGNYEYTRTGSPTRDAFENCVAAMEGAKFGAAFGSGLAATMTLIQTLKAGDEVVSIDDVYGGTQRYFNKIATKFGIVFKYVDLANDIDGFRDALTENTRFVWVETPTNPTLKIADIELVSKVAHEKFKDIRVVVDNTFMSPYFQRPLSLGADVVLHSISKYINGHSDVIGGVIITNDEPFFKEVKYLQNAVGAILSPFDSYMALRGCKTLAVRMKQHAQTAQVVAELLEKHPKVEKVAYPGLASHPQHEIAKKQMTGYGGMITFWIKGGLDQARVFLETLKIFALAESLGGVESLAEHPAIMTHASVPAEARKRLGISDTLIRLSVGIEEEEDIVKDILDALEAAPEVK